MVHPAAGARSWQDWDWVLPIAYGCLADSSFLLFYFLKFLGGYAGGEEEKDGIRVSGVRL